MAEESTNNPLEDVSFSFRQFKNGAISISYEGKEITILKGKSAANFLAGIENTSEMDEQMAMAKVTGNFKRGNERQAKETGRK